MRVIFQAQMLRYKIKWAFQRMRRGFSDCDVWAIDVWFLKVIPKMLRQLKDTTHSAPAFHEGPHIYAGTEENDDNFQQWQNILSQMLDLLKEMNTETNSYTNPYAEEWMQYIDGDLYADVPEDLRKKFVEHEIIRHNKVIDAKNEFFKMFSQYFYDLWD